MDPITLLIYLIIFLLFLAIAHYVMVMINIKEPVRNIVMIVVLLVALVLLLQRTGLF